MREKLIHIIIRLSAALFAAAIVVSCATDWTEDMQPDYSYPSGNYGERIVNEEVRKVMLLYSAGFNSLSSYLESDIEDLKTGWIPTRHRNSDIVLVYSHFPESPRKYDTETSPVLFRLYRKNENDTTVVADTLVVYKKGTISASANQLNEVLGYVKDNFKAQSYGMVFSSHATGYLPAGYYQKPNDYIFEADAKTGRRKAIPSPVPYVEPEFDPSLPMTKSIGQDQVGTYGSYSSYEIDLKDFAEAIPMKLDYLLFDACLMGGVETAYELQDKVGILGCSQTEVLAEGFNYKELTKHLLQNDTPDPIKVCEDFFIQYDIQTGAYRSATISCIDCSNLTSLAETCEELFGIYNTEIRNLSSSSVQKFYRSEYHWFFDLESILMNAGASSDELNRLYEALDKCIIYKAHTPSFMNSFDIHTFCGFSMYLPSNGSTELDKYYKTLKWNQATGLVR